MLFRDHHMISADALPVGAAVSLTAHEVYRMQKLQALRGGSIDAPVSKLKSSRTATSMRKNMNYAEEVNYLPANESS